MFGYGKKQSGAANLAALFNNMGAEGGAENFAVMLNNMGSTENTTLGGMLNTLNARGSRNYSESIQKTDPDNARAFTQSIEKAAEAEIVARCEALNTITTDINLIIRNLSPLSHESRSTRLARHCGLRTKHHAAPLGGIPMNNA